jgi:hypothetical protein
LGWPVLETFLVQKVVASVCLSVHEIIHEFTCIGPTCTAFMVREVIGRRNLGVFADYYPCRS